MTQRRLARRVAACLATRRARGPHRSLPGSRARPARCAADRSRGASTARAHLARQPSVRSYLSATGATTRGRTSLRLGRAAVALRCPAPAGRARSRPPGRAGARALGPTAVGARWPDWLVDEALDVIGRHRRELCRRQHRWLARRLAFAVAEVRPTHGALLDGLEDLEQLVAGERFLVDQLEHEVIEDVAVLDEDLPCLV